MIAVLSVIRAPGDTGRQTTRAGTYTVPYIVKVQRGRGDNSPAAQAIFAHEDMKKQWTSANNDDRALAVGRSAKLRGSVISSTGVVVGDSFGTVQEIYDVEIEYQTLDTFPTGVYDVRGRAARVEDVAWLDLNYAGICNTAGDFYSPLPVRYRYNDVLSISCRFDAPYWSPSKYGRALGSINIDNWQCWPRRTVMFRDQVYQRKPLIDKIPLWAELEPAYYYWDVQFEFEVNLKGWNPHRMLCCGRQVKGANKKKSQAKDDYQVRHGGKILLDKNGAALDVSNPAYVRPHYTEHRLYREVSFSIFDFVQRPLFNSWSAFSVISVSENLV